LTYCYLPLDWLLRPTRDRVRRLWVEYDFVCDCARCTGPDWARGLPCDACATSATTTTTASAIAPPSTTAGAAEGRARCTFPTETAFLQAVASHGTGAAADAVAPTWACVVCASVAAPSATRLAREAHWRGRWAVLEGPLEAGAGVPTTPAGPTPLEPTAFAAERARLESELGTAHHLGVAWRRMQADALMLLQPAHAWAESGHVAAYCERVLGASALGLGLRGPFLVRLANTTAAAVAAGRALPSPQPHAREVRPVWVHWAPLLRPEDRAVAQALMQTLAAAAGCAHCHAAAGSARTPMLQTCGRCHAVAYCAPTCQRADWKRHKKECMPAMAATTPVHHDAAA
jgi:hypothetical protein